MFVTNPIGIIGEEEAAKMLEKKKLHVVEHNWRMGHLEVDLIAENKEEIVFVEVKARTTTFGDVLPEENVDEIKRKRMIAAANAYIKYRKTEKTPRFDIIGIMVNPETNEVTYRSHMENAFQPRMKAACSGTHNGQWHWGRSTKTKRNK